MLFRSGTVSEVLADGAIRLELSATSAGVKVLGMAKAVVVSNYFAEN